MAIVNGEYGEKVWERKINSQNEVGVIAGVVSNINDINKGTKKVIGLLKSKVFPNIPKEAKILDAGCGPMARFSIEFAKLGYKVTGCDISKTTLDYAKKYSKESKTDIHFLKTDMTELENISNSSFDLIFCYATFYHIPPHLTGISLIRFNQKLKDNGLCLIEFGIRRKNGIKDSLYSPIYWTGHYIKRAFKKGFNVNVSRFSRKEIDEIIEKSGFKKEKILNESIYLLRKNILINHLEEVLK